jgi:hypothetical protein
VLGVEEARTTPDHRQKKLAKDKQKRANAGRSGAAVREGALLANLQRKLVARFQDLPLGPWFVTRGWRNPEASRLQCVVATPRTGQTGLAPVVHLQPTGCRLRSAR